MRAPFDILRLDSRRRFCRRTLLVLLLAGIAPGNLLAGNVIFEDIAADGANGLDYARTPSATISIFDAFVASGIYSFADLPLSPMKPHGAPGLAMLDYDGDGDLDLYVTNGPGSANSLFANQLADGGGVSFVDLAADAGVDATDQDSSGTCFGDIDNDGDPDLLVLSQYDTNRLFENNGDGTFTDISATAGLGGGQGSLSCSFGDVDGDGLLDVAVANISADMSNSLSIVVPFDFARHNQLFHNQGGNAFTDVSASAGIEGTSGFVSPIFDGRPTPTWAIALVDIDQDGDVDLIQADDQGGVPFARDGGLDYGLIHWFENDGNGQFTDRTAGAGLAKPGSWMGLSFGDLDGDGELDFFGSNLGDYATTLLSPLDPTYSNFALYLQGDMASRWFYNDGVGGFADPGVGPLEATPFGWGTSIADYDNDGDSDILFHGGLYFGPVAQGSPAALLENDGSGTFDRDAVAFAGSTDHQARTVQGVAMGDLDGNGFPDMVSVSNFDVDPAAQSTYNHAWGSPFDFGRYGQVFTPTGDFSGDGIYEGFETFFGSLSVELNSGNANGWVKVRTVGSVGLTEGAVVNRDGIGAVVRFERASGDAVLRPVLGGSSYASQDALEGTFGLGHDFHGTVEIRWPGGVRNRLYGVHPGETIIFPEIPCSYDGEWENPAQYVHCVRGALHDLVEAGAIPRHQRSRFYVGALLAFFRL